MLLIWELISMDRIEMPITQSLEFTLKWKRGHICLFNETEERGKKYIKPIPARPKLSTFRHWNGQLNDILSWRVGDGAISSRDGVSVVYILSWQLVPNISGQDDPRYAFIFFSVYIPCYFFFFFGFQRDKEKYDEVHGHTNNAYNVATNPFRAAS